MGVALAHCSSKIRSAWLAPSATLPVGDWWLLMVSSFIEAFTGSNRFVIDYLADEVLARRPAHVRDFLLDTVVIGRLTGPLCDAVTGRADGTRMLEDIERANLFLVALDNERSWYRYRHLFADVLQARRGADGPAGCRGCISGPANGSPPTTLPKTRSGTRSQPQTSTAPPT
jgi:hypothetical protein